MKISRKKIVWLGSSAALSIFVGYNAFLQPAQLIPLIDLLATIVSILIGVSLAISAVLSTRPAIGSMNYTNAEEKKRIEKILKHDDRSLIEGQNIIFWFYYLTLILAVIFKWITTAPAENTEIISSLLHVKIIAGAFGSVSTLALLWSATLPSLLKSVNMQRKNLD